MDSVIDVDAEHLSEVLNSDMSLLDVAFLIRVVEVKGKVIPSDGLTVLAWCVDQVGIGLLSDDGDMALFGSLGVARFFVGVGVELNGIRRWDLTVTHVVTSTTGGVWRVLLDNEGDTLTTAIGWVVFVTGQVVDCHGEVSDETVSHGRDRLLVPDLTLLVRLAFARREAPTAIFHLLSAI